MTKAVTAILNEIIPAASFKSDSPSSMDIDPLGKTFPFVIADTATASVGHRIAAIAKAAGIGKLGQIQWIKKPTPITVVNTKAIAIRIIGFLYSSNFVLETCVPSTNSKGAMTAIIKTSESKSKWMGIGKVKMATPNAICIKAVGILGNRLCIIELITTAIIKIIKASNNSIEISL